MAEPTCQKCGADMEPGFVVDHSYGTAAASEWIEGPVEASHSFRCVGCGYLELYAR